MCVDINNVRSCLLFVEMQTNFYCDCGGLENDLIKNYYADLNTTIHTNHPINSKAF